MAKILSQAGQSLADIYDVEGSIAGIDSLETRDLPIVHEMGQTVFSERFRTEFRRSATGNIAQNTDFDVVITDLRDTISRLLGVVVFSDDDTRVLRAAVMVRDPISNGGLELPVWVWDGATAIAVRMVDFGSLGLHNVLVASAPATFLPNFTGGTQQGPTPVDQIALRGRTTGFGAGTVAISAVYFIASSSTPGGVSSVGLPVPSW